MIFSRLRDWKRARVRFLDRARESVIFSRLRDWKRAKVRFLVQFGGAPHYPYYVRLTPSLGAGIPWPKDAAGRPRRLRVAKHHGAQITTWQGARWVVTRQLLGASSVIKEAIFLE